MRTVVLATIAIALSPLSSAQTKGNAAPPGNAENGKRLFTSYGCFQCHGGEGQGGAAGPRLAPRPIALATLVTYVRHPTGQMPPFTSKVVTDSELADIHAYLRSIPEPPPVKSLPQLNP